MIYKHVILCINNEEVLYLCLENNYEFSKDINDDTETNNIYKKISKYIKYNNIKFNGKRIFLVVDNIIIGSLILYKDSYTKIKVYIDIPVLEDSDIEIIDIYGENENNLVNIKRVNKFFKIDLNDYIANVLLLKISMSYYKEAIKAMSVLIRTNALKDILKFGYINDCEYEEDFFLKNKFKEKYDSYLKKARVASMETDNQFLTFKNSLSYLPISLLNNKEKISNYCINLMAKVGYNYKQILKKYYPETVLQN